jgi:hypothetical protein
MELNYTAKSYAANDCLAHLNQEKLKKAVQLSFDVYCGVIAMFKSFSEVSFDIVFVEKG